MGGVDRSLKQRASVAPQNGDLYGVQYCATKFKNGKVPRLFKGTQGQQLSKHKFYLI